MVDCKATGSYMIFVPLILILLCQTAVLSAQTDNYEQNTRIFLLVVSNNKSLEKGVPSLKYADDDGARYFEILNPFTHSSYFLATLDEDSQRLYPILTSKTLPPTKDNLNRTIDKLIEEIETSKDDGYKTELYTVFTGHGGIDDKGEGYLNLTDSRFTRSDLYNSLITKIKADTVHLIVDSCNAFYMVQSRKDWKNHYVSEDVTDDFRAYLRSDDDLLQYPNVGVILATSSAGEVHEWSLLQAGVFSHVIHSALLGGADIDEDGDVTYSEVQAFVTSAFAGIKNAKAKVKIYVHPPAQNRRKPLINLTKMSNSAVQVLKLDRGGRFYVEDSRGVRYADLNTGAFTPLSLILLPYGDKKDKNSYYIKTDTKEIEIPLLNNIDFKKPLSLASLTLKDRNDIARGSIDESFKKGLFAIPFDMGFYTGYISAKADHSVEKSVLLGVDVKHRLYLGYTMGSALIEQNGLQHGFRLEYHLRLGRFFSIGPSILYSQSNHTKVDKKNNNEIIDFSLKRYFIGVQGLGEHKLFNNKLSLFSILSLGHQWVLHEEANNLKGDPVSFHSSIQAGIAYRLTKELSFRLSGEVSANLVTVSDADKIFFIPSMNSGIMYQF